MPVLKALPTFDGSLALRSSVTLRETLSALGLLLILCRLLFSVVDTGSERANLHTLGKGDAWNGHVNKTPPGFPTGEFT